MAVLVADCPRCAAKRMTFDVLKSALIRREHQWQHWFETFVVCRSCFRSTTFLVKQKDPLGSGRKIEDLAPEKLGADIDVLYAVVRYVSLREQAITQAPEHLPEELARIFGEGATCFAVACYNASATMFRLCIDKVTWPLLPNEDDASEDQPNQFQRRYLGPRMDWLFDRGKLPSDLRGLAACIREDGNDGAHAGNLTKVDAEDVVDFAYQLLDRLVSEPERIKLAIERRNKRRLPKK